MFSLSDPLRIGPVKVPNRVFLAPMSGVSDLPFRRLALSHGAGLAVSEMIASEELCKASAESRKRMQADSSVTGPRVIQLAGREARWMAEAARIAADAGADIIDINMGCPAKKVTGGQSGSALMREPDHALSLIEAVLGAVKVPVTVKMRLGWDHQSINAPELARRAQAAGVQMITVHGRTRCQFYDGRADWAAVCAVRSAITVPLIVNGDIQSAADAGKALEMSGADAVMIGRAAYGQPWLPGQLADAGSQTDAPWLASATHLGAYVTAHHTSMLEHYGVETGIRHARKHLGWYADRHGADHPDFTALRARLMRETEPRAIHRLVATLFDRQIRGRHGRGATGRMSTNTAEIRPANSGPQTNGHATLVLNTMRDPVVMIAADNSIIYANLEAQNFFLTSRSQLIKEKISDFIPFSSPMLALIEQARHGKIADQRIPRGHLLAAAWRRPDGRYSRHAGR